jgi:hypothetical protein
MDRTKDNGVRRLGFINCLATLDWIIKKDVQIVYLNANCIEEKVKFYLGGESDLP